MSRERSECPRHAGPARLASSEDITIACTCQTPTAPHTRRRHPESDPAQSQRKDYAQCQYCWKSKADGITLKKCAACQMEEYCSRECQKNAWPSHKARCKMNRSTQQITQEMHMPDVKTLYSFAQKHRANLANCSIVALDLFIDPTRCMRFVLLVELYPRPESRRIETSFYVTEAKVVPLEEFGAQADELRKQLALANEEQKKSGALGTLFVLLRANLPTGQVTNVTGVGFGEHSLQGLRRGLPWKEKLKKMLNEGITG
ncbi:hypothetical protein BOTBODRAFT_149196 [Botryobasidium botryosum FD-172 SS1]|uniref:MYND-type domain-containing protein n=1 Tax=Botryobasidium botryosum (strain FD-172 SS1) TaxID=930990 RepID=A0A067LVW8_BOTB1|nr:hypothetical protein BOTBODRAFT_149196 [Botryobasidium botryosum FD-172 SS1]